MNLDHVTISPCHTHHLYNGTPFYTPRFLSVLKFHEPGLAPAVDEAGAFHIDTNGRPAYQGRYLRTFGFYGGLAAVASERGAFHIAQTGLPAYKNVYEWCGNFQEDVCVVKDGDGRFFYIRKDGSRLLPQSYDYAGDFKDGIAVITLNGKGASHIDKGGKYIHDKWYSQLGVYHKGFACCEDHRGWCHIDKAGGPLYNARYKNVEPFYNGVALCQTFAGDKELLSEEGKILSSVAQNICEPIDQLSSDLVSFWRASTIFALVELEFLPLLPATTYQISQARHLPPENVSTLLSGAWELGLLLPCNSYWEITEKGRLLLNGHFMHSAAVMWKQVEMQWRFIFDWIKLDPNVFRHSFKELETDASAREAYEVGILGYAEKDFLPIADKIPWEKYKNVLGVTKTALPFLNVAERKTPQPLCFLGDDEASTNNFPFPNLLPINLHAENPFESCHDGFDLVLFPRVLLHYPDKVVERILTKTREILLPNGILYIFEPTLKFGSPDFSLLSLNMLVESGGKVRSQKDWGGLLRKIGLDSLTFEEVSPLLTMICARPNGESNAPKKPQ